MNVSRRGLLGMFAAGAGAAIIRTPGLLMPIKPQPEEAVARVILPGSWRPCFVDFAAASGQIEFPVNPHHGDTVRLNRTTYVFAPLMPYRDPPIIERRAGGFREFFSLEPGSVNRA